MNSTSLHVDGRLVPLDKEGFLVNLADWDESVACALGERENISIGPEHMQVILAVRRFYRQYQLSPAMRPLVKHIGQELGPEKGKSLYLLKLFPDSPAKLVSKLAGLPKPDNCL